MSRAYWIAAERQLLARLGQQYPNIDAAISAGACTEQDWCAALDEAREPRAASSDAPKDYRRVLLEVLGRCPEVTANDLLRMAGIARGRMYNTLKLLRRDGLIEVIPGRCGHNPRPMVIKLVQP